MNKKSIKLKKIFNKIILKKKLSDSAFLKLKINQIKEWDSMQNMHLLLEIEKKFDLKFSFKEMNTLNSINKILKRI
jgi:acyl carrier protein